MLNKAKMEEFVSDIYSKSLQHYFYYHNFNHSLYVANIAVEIGRHSNCTEDELDLLYIAGLWHDCGYIHTYKNHEAESCSMAQKYLPAFGITQNEIKQICGMIMATKIPHLPTNKLEEIIADADLAYLGTEQASLLAQNLYRELLHIHPDMDEAEWDKKQISFIEKHRYFTSFCLENKEPSKASYLQSLRDKKR